ncbi:MAG: aminopeptidase N [Gammaproteobacteria bacterium]|nr:aminopeptidase N [Gammaproteobacteria bacterium]
MAKDPQAPRPIYLSEYKPADYVIDTVDLYFDLHETATRVKARLGVRKRAGVLGPQPLVLHGEDLKLLSIAIDGVPLDKSGYQINGEQLTIHRVPDVFTLTVENEINPQANTSLNGLYISSGNFCTQCEAEGFRRITYMYDRPDIMAKYTTTIVADKNKFPVLLSNGNLVDKGDVESDPDKHWAKWEDPFPKPTYLFALVAGNLERIEDTFTTRSGREVALHIYVQSHNIDKCDHAMRSLKKAMKWDEEVYGREYDLDIYMIVAVDDFNMGAMENKGLNVFNSKYVLAKPETATDHDYDGIEGVIGHEYFHNWSGNRVTCRDWFQLSLKEGFTVFRDQEFSADMTSRGVKRISDVNILRTNQFREDASPMAHPVRPDSYVEINNFYTVTVYNKGAEVVRVLHHLLGPEKFRKGTDLYFDRHDGQAVTCDDFVKAMEDANQADLTQFRRWYSQAGTPELHVSRHYDAAHKTYTLTIRQTCPPTPGQEKKEPFLIPLAVGLLDESGKDMPMQLRNEAAAVQGTRVLEIRQVEESYTFIHVNSEPAPSLLRGFSAPVKVNLDLKDQERYFLMANDSDDFNRWDAGQQLAVKIIKQLVEDFQQHRPLYVPEPFIDAYRSILEDVKLDRSLAAQAISLPAESYIAEFVSPIDPVAIHKVCRFIRETLATHLKDLLRQVYDDNRIAGAYSFEQEHVKKRALKNTCLGYLMETGDASIHEMCYAQFRQGNNMTDVMAALVSLANNNCPQREDALAAFYAKWKNELLVVDKWLAIQATSRLPGTLERVKELTSHESFTLKNPNKIRALIGSFGHGNPAQFHDLSGEGYKFFTGRILEIDKLNPQIAARLATVYTLWKKYDEPRQQLMKQQLDGIIAEPGLSKDVYEIASKSLG